MPSPNLLLVEIRTLDVDDDEEMRTAFGILTRDEAVGREDKPPWTFDNFTGMLRSADPGEHREPRVGLVDGEMVAYGIAELFLLDNTDKAWIQVRVDPPHWGQGHGRAMLEHLVAIVEDSGRTEVLAEAKVPIDEVHTHPCSLFLTDQGFIHSISELVRYLPLPVDDGEIQGWLDQAAEKHPGYRVETYGDDIPAELLPGLFEIWGQLAVDAPSGAVDFEEEVMTPERYKEHQATIKAMGRTVLETLAIAPDGTVAAQSTLSVPTDDDVNVWQWGTFVHREHRGHRLGLATKAANLRALQTRFPGKTRIVTQNGESNDFMVSINVLMGFELVEASAEFVRRLGS
jgi:GNAT superfamily N-acetyltransferase